MLIYNKCLCTSDAETPIRYEHDIWQVNIVLPIVKPDMSPAHRRLKSPWSLSGTSAHPTTVTLVNIMVMNGRLTSFSFHVNRPSHSWDKTIQTLALKFEGQGHGCGQRARSYSWPSILLIRFLFISHQSDQQFLRYSYFEIWPWNIQGQHHEWGQRSGHIYT